MIKRFLCLFLAFAVNAPAASITASFNPASYTGALSGSTLSLTDGAGTFSYQNTSQANIVATGTNTTLILDATGGSVFPGISLKVSGVAKTSLISDGTDTLFYATGAIRIGAGAIGGAEDLTIASNGSVTVAGALAFGAGTASADLTFSDVSEGPVIKSPDGNRWRIQVDNAGVISAVDLDP